MSEWTFVKLGSLAHFKNGLNFSKDNWGKGLKVIGVGDFKDYSYPKYDTLDEINPDGVVRNEDYLEEGDFLFVRSNGNRLLIGRSLYIKNLSEKISHSGFTIRLRFTSSDVYKPFYIYIFKSSLIRSVLSLHGGGTNINNLNQEILSKLDVPLPCLSTQKKIAAILSAYDDLIENNRRRIALLEKMAEEIYREWFVRLRFPGYEQVKFHKGVPEEWKVVKLSDILELAYGKPLREDNRITGNYPVFGSGGIISTHTTYLVKGPGIIIGRKGNVGSVYWSESNFYPIDTVYYVKSNLSPYFLFYLLQVLNFINNDAAVPGLNRNQAYSNKLYLPPQSLINKYTQLIKGIYNLKESLKHSNQNLKQTRDRLLTRLICGKLSIEDLNIQFPPSMVEENLL